MDDHSYAANIAKFLTLAQVTRERRDAARLRGDVDEAWRAAAMLEVYEKRARQWVQAEAQHDKRWGC